MKRILLFAGGLLASVLLGQPAIAQVALEFPGVVGRAVQVYGDPDQARTSYAAVDRAGSCSGAMIGPNIMLTAGHCNQTSAVDFTLYPSPSQRQVERFSSRQLLHTFIDTDIVLRYVAPNAAGEHPGDKYGYLDLDIVLTEDGLVDYGSSRALLAVGTPVYSFWQNVLQQPTGRRELLVSQGEITANGRAGMWFNPNLPDGTETWRCTNNGRSRALGVRDDAWGVQGASGSLTLSGERHRLLLGPLSLANTAGNAGPGRDQLAIVDYLRHGYADPANTAPSCNPGHRSTVSTAALRQLGIAEPADFFGEIDKNRDGIFDVQHALEELRGETARDFYWLGFESHRRNRLWTVDQPRHVRFDVDDGLVELETRSASSRSVTALVHQRLNLDPTRTWRVSFVGFLTRRPDSGAPFPISVELAGRSGPAQRVDLDPATDGVFMTASFTPTDESIDQLRFALGRGAELLLLGVSVMADDAVIDFDSHDKRVSWHGPGGGPALVWPNGRNATTTADWAGVVYRDQGRQGSFWTLGHNGLGLAAGEAARICFDVRRAPRRASFPDGMVQRARILEGLREIADISFTPGADWSRHCTPWFTPQQQSARLQFGTVSESTFSTGAYLVDDVAVERRPTEN